MYVTRQHGKIGMFGLQAYQLLQHQEQKDPQEQAGAQQVLRQLQSAHCPQGNEIVRDTKSSCEILFYRFL